MNKLYNSIPYTVVMARCFVPLLILIFIVNVPNRANAQIAEYKEFHTWTDVATIYFFNPNFRYDGDYGLRGVITDSNWTLLYVRPSVRYSEWTWMQLHGGAALFYNFFKDGNDLPEVRPWLGVRFIWPRLAGFVFSHYLRMEYRAFYFKSEKKWENSFRGRYQLQISNNNFSIGELRGFVALASIELFEDMNTLIDGVFGDRYRFNIGFGKRVFDDLRIDINYVFHRVNLGGGKFEADDHIIRTRFFYNFNWLQDFMPSEGE